MAWDVEVTDEFVQWFQHSIGDAERESVVSIVGLLESEGPQLKHPYSSGISGHTAPSHA
jgi:hypothetical protein